MRNELFSSVDAAWLHIDRRTNLAVIVGVMMFETPISWLALKRVIEERLLVYERFRQRVKEPLLPVGLPRWEMDPHFDWDYHLMRAQLSGAGGEAELKKLASDLMSQPLDPHRPLWQFHYVENFGSGCALVARLHHCIADGLALVQVLLSLTDADLEAVHPPAAPLDSTEKSSEVFHPLQSAAHLLDLTTAAARTVAREGVLTIAHPERVTQAAGLGALTVMSAGKLLLLSPDQPTGLKGKCHVAKRAAWSEPIPLTGVKQIAHAMRSTINDVLLAAATGALRRYLEERGEAVEPQLNIRAMIPISIRAAADFDKLGNQFGLVILSLPLGVRDPIGRIKLLKQRMDEIKDTPEAFVAFSILGLMGNTPVTIERLITDIFADKTSAVMTNVPGPRQPIYLAGQKLKSLMFWVPRAGDIGLGLSILSYAGNVYIGIASDVSLIPEPDRIVDCFQREVADMLRQTAPARLLPPEQFTPSNQRCQAVTQSGQRCKNHALPEMAYCRVHAKLPQPVR